MKKTFKKQARQLSSMQKLHRVALTMGAAVATFVMGIWSKPNTVHADTTDHNVSTSSADDLNQSAAATAGNVTSAVPTNQVLTTENVDLRAGSDQVENSNNYALHDQSSYQPHTTRVKRVKKLRSTVTSAAVNPTSTSNRKSSTVAISDSTDPSMAATSSTSVSSRVNSSYASSSDLSSSVVNNGSVSVDASASVNVVSASTIVSNSVNALSSSTNSDAISSNSTVSSTSSSANLANDWTPLSSGLANDAIKTMVKPIFATNDNPDQPSVDVSNQSYYGLNQSNLTLPVAQYDQETSLYSIDPNAGQKYFGQMVQLTQDAQQHSTFDFVNDPKPVKADYGSQFLVRDVIVKNGVARFLLDNGMYLTANVNYVKLVNNLTNQA